MRDRILVSDSELREDNGGLSAFIGLGSLNLGRDSGHSNSHVHMIIALLD
ncbi:MAG: hypothetical protein LUQ47_02675 [Methanotrichaceae archaeon]|nr:hypothetical protein [Methanotrichaceae archaeon]